MLRTLPVLTFVALVSISIFAPMAAGEQRLNVLRHFASLPAGLDAEGLAIRDGHFYVGTISFTASDGTILVVNRDGTVMRRFTISGLPFVGQVAFNGAGTLFAVAGNIMTGRGEVVRVDLKSGAVTTVAAGFELPNGLVVDRHGNLFVTDLLAGTVSKVTPGGAVSVFASDPLLAPALVSQVGLTLGPNDLAFSKDGDALYVTNVGKGTVVKVKMGEEGETAGAITNFAIVPTPDGVAFDEKGNLYVTSPFTNSVWVVGKDGSAHPLPLDTTHEGLNNPSNVAFQGRQLYVTNLGLMGSSGVSVATVEFPGVPLKA